MSTNSVVGRCEGKSHSSNCCATPPVASSIFDATKPSLFILKGIRLRHWYTEDSITELQFHFLRSCVPRARMKMSIENVTTLVGLETTFKTRARAPTDRVRKNTYRRYRNKGISNATLTFSQPRPCMVITYLWVAARFRVNNLVVYNSKRIYRLEYYHSK